jgi:hypothetical protein
MQTISITSTVTGAIGFAAWEQPQIFADELRAEFGSVR